jgi:hypothetical protein
MLARSGQGATCKEECDDGATTNGNYVTPKYPAGNANAGKPDPTAKYGVCTACDIPCGTCAGQRGWTSKAKDTAICKTCSVEFPYVVKVEKTCFVRCPSGYYEVKN